MQITKNFSKAEFNSKDGSTMPEEVYYNIVKLANNLQTLRDKLGVPVIINSGYRSESHNRKVGGSRTSQHLYGKAADIKVEGLSSYELYTIIENLINEGEMLQGGLGLYDNFVHYDIRKTKARWDYRGK